MKNISRKLPIHLETLLIILVLILLLVTGPWVYSSVIPYFAILDQHTLFDSFILIGLVSLIVYVITQAKKNLQIPYAVSSFVFGMVGYNFWHRVIEIPQNFYLVLGVIAVSFVVFRRGLNVDVTGSKKSIIKSIIIGIVSAIVIFIVTNFILKLVFPNMNEVLIYSITGLLTILGAHNKSLSLPRMDIVRFSYDMVIFVILYNFLVFSSRVTVDSVISIGRHLPVYGASFMNTVYGALIGLIGAYLLHRHHLIWDKDNTNSEQNIYSIALLCGILALSFLIGANPFIAAGIMGFLVSMRDYINNPQDYILTKFESYLDIIVFLVLGAGISFNIFVSLLTFSTSVVLCISLFSTFILVILLYIFSKLNIFTRASFKTYLNEISHQSNLPILVGAVALFIISNTHNLENIIISLSFVFILFLYYVYPLFITKTSH